MPALSHPASLSRPGLFGAQACFSEAVMHLFTCRLLEAKKTHQ